MPAFLKIRNEAPIVLFMDSAKRQLLIKEIKFRGRRGMKELDLWIGDYIAVHVDGLADEELEPLRDLLLTPEQILWGWLEKGEADAPFNTPAFTKLYESRRGS